MIRLWHILVFAVALLAFSVARAPASLIIRPSEGFSYDKAEGTIWDARLSGARIAGLDAGAMTAKVSFFGVAQGKLDMPISFSGADLDGTGRLLANLDGDRRIVVDRLVLNRAPMGSVVLAGQTEVRDLDIFFLRGKCNVARGSVRTDVLQKNANAFGMEGPELAGQAGCVGDHAEISMNGAQGDRTYLVKLILRGDGSAEARTVVSPTPTEVLASLTPLGFTLDPSTGGASMRKDLRWFPS